MDSIFKDIRYGIRSLLKRPAFAAVAVITLALGIGANTAIFSVINAVLLRPLSYEQPERLVTFRSNQSAPDLEDVIKASRTFTKLGGEVLAPLAYTAGAEPIQFQVGQVTGGYFDTLGVNAERGRYITQDDDKSGGPFVVVLSHDLWKRQFNGDSQILGKTIPLSGNVYTVIGVMPAGFKSPRENAEAWTPVHISNPVAAGFRSVHFLRTYGRLAPGVTLFSYRVFPQGENASNFNIAKAIDRARTDGCDLINLSLGRPADAGEGPDEPLVRFALEDARASGMLPIAAAGNDGRAPVAFPGSDDLCLAVSALGNRKTQPASSVSTAAFAPPAGADPNEFVADFSNIGPEIDLIGPGVGVISTVPTKDFAVMDGTSMACPAVTGIVARLLAAQSAILNLARNDARAAAIAQLALQAARSRGFAAQFEGHGLPI